jgi:thiosulfate dehydrogenase
MSDRRRLGGVTLATTGALGAVVIGGTLFVSQAPDGPSGTRLPTAAYGRLLLDDTAAYLGPDHPDPEMQYTGTSMSCASCHLGTGTQPGTLSLLQAAGNYPDFSGREGRDRDLQDRINGCMQRSMNGRPLPRDGVEILAMVAYIQDLGEQYAAMGDTRRAATEQPRFAEPDRAADVDRGREVFDERCAVCHGADGLGLAAAGDPREGYLFPPLWGPDSYNNGAGMHRVLTAAKFIKARMPFGEADLANDDAYDVAAYINSHPRPEMANLDRDYPDRTAKPPDSPYPPYADPFPRDQHRFGPFAPIREYYARLRDAPGSGGGH